MSTAGSIVTRALRAGNIIPVSTVPTAAEMTEGTEELSSLLRSLFGEELSAHYRDWHVPLEWTTEQEQRHPLTPNTDDVSLDPWRYPPENSRLLVKIASPVTILLPAAPMDGARISVVDTGSTANLTLHANGLKIEDAEYITNTLASLTGKEWFYRADLANWILLQDEYTELEDLPLHESVDDFFVTTLAILFAPRHGKKIEESIVQRQAAMQSRLVARYRVGAVPASPAELRNILRTTP